MSSIFILLLSIMVQHFNALKQIDFKGASGSVEFLKG